MVFLASDDSAWVTGERLAAACGRDQEDRAGVGSLLLPELRAGEEARELARVEVGRDPHATPAPQHDHEAVTDGGRRPHERDRGEGRRRRRRPG